MPPITYSAGEVAKYFSECIICLKDNPNVPGILEQKSGNEIYFVETSWLSPGKELKKTLLPAMNDWEDFVQNQIITPRIHSYVLYGKAGCFVSRAGTRQTEKGIHQRALSIRDPVGALTNLSVSSLSLAAHAIAKQPPKFKDAFQLFINEKRLCVPFSRDWAFYNLEGRTVLGYRGSFVGIVNHGGALRLAGCADHLKESLDEAAGGGANVYR